MSHTVVRLNTTLNDSLKTEELKNTIKTELESRGYKTNEVAVNDGETMDGDPRLRVNIDFIKPGEANSFSSYLKKLAEANTEYMESGIVDSHECMHLEGLNEPCEPVVVWRL